MAMESKVNLQQNNFFHLENSMVMYSIFDLGTLEKLNTTVHKIHNTTTWNENLFASKLNHWFQWYLSQDEVGHYAINSLLYLRTLREKYVKIFQNLSCNYECMPKQ